MARGDGERVARVIDRGSEAADASVAKVVRAEHGRVVGLIVGDAFNVTRAVERRVDRDRVTTSRAARVREGEGLVVMRSCETAPRGRLARAGAREAIPTHTILLLRITRRQLTGRNDLIGTAGTGWDGEGNRLGSTCVSELQRKVDRGAAGE